MEVAPKKSGGRTKKVARKDMDMESNSKEDARGRGKSRTAKRLTADERGSGSCSGSSAEPGVRKPRTLEVFFKITKPIGLHL